MLVYICSPYRGDIRTNTRLAKYYSRQALERGYVPVAPHLLYPSFIDEGTERDIAIKCALEILSRCDQLWICGDQVSAGMKEEINYAEEKHIVIRRINHE